MNTAIEFKSFRTGATNDSASGRQQNRRVEVTIHASESAER